MTQPLLPPRGIFVPSHILFNNELPATMIITWIQLRALAWDGWITPPLPLKEISQMLGKSQRTLLTHLSKLTTAAGVTWQATENGTIIVSIPNFAIHRPRSRMESGNIPPDEHPDSLPIMNSFTSYFPPKIMGYITYSDELE